MSQPGTFAFMRDVVTWSERMAAAIAIAGTLLTRDWRFALAFVVGAAFDIGTVAVFLHRVPDDSPDLVVAGREASVLIGGRVALKAVLLGAAALVPALFSLWGMFAGVLVFDLTLMTVGSFNAAAAVRR